MTPKTPSRGLFVASEPPSGSPTSSMTSKKSSIRDWISRTPSLLRRFSAPSRKAAAQPTAVPSPTVNLAQQSQDMLEIAEPNNVRIVSRAKAAWVISILTGVTFVGNMSTGLVTISLPTIARDLGLAPHLLLCILTNNFIAGRQRNVGFACVGLSQPLGFSFGLILGGVVVDTYLTWRFAFYFTAGLMGLLFLVSIWLLPQDTPREKFTWPRFLREIDWIGACLISAALGITSYVLAVITGNMAKAKNAENIVMLCIAGTSAVSFGFWMHFREKSGRIALIPNSLWRKRAFTTICLLVFLTYAVLNGVEYFLSLFFQEVQLLSALDAAIRFFPEVVVGILLNLFTGLFVHKINANLLITVSAALTCVAPLIMAFIDPAWNFWVAAFWAAIVCPFSVDVIFTVANLIITDAFSEGTQALAGAVFSTVAQFGHSVGLMVMAVTSNRVTAKSSIEDKESPEAIMEGYRVVFWLCFGMQLMACFVSVWGLRGVGKVGLKRE
ncbi:uncharacterized protein VDAG_08029 [Verticillium dahliae VdLs.17]|uniref:Integral membrane protein n=1 Tax=Verticillium dahliae (strain VdLs.17 / ATCC MYA-4575 / FGSC 10137) TaxID=498257 RepID=G2XCZ7_VERDV|nr:uncharacterized protein VDAG_08029 [Verticillium dahliae VdLs.17]EGY16865.1 integral membrane protein [Verticillium dahliae VdLs.17]KAH6706762.1 integral membrane protein [Verticillium dahliae]